MHCIEKVKHFAHLKLVSREFRTSWWKLHFWRVNNFPISSTRQNEYWWETSFLGSIHFTVLINYYTFHRLILNSVNFWYTEMYVPRLKFQKWQIWYFQKTEHHSLIFGSNRFDTFSTNRMLSSRSNAFRCPKICLVLLSVLFAIPMSIMMDKSNENCIHKLAQIKLKMRKTTDSFYGR